MSNIFLEPTVRNEPDFVKKGKFITKLTDFATFKANHKLMVAEGHIEKDSRMNLSSDDEARQKYIPQDHLYHDLRQIEKPTIQDWINYDCKCAVNIGIEIFQKSGFSASSGTDLGVVLQDWGEYITNSNYKVNISTLRHHLLLMDARDSNDLIFTVAKTLGESDKWKANCSSDQVKMQVISASELMFGKTDSTMNGSKCDWRQHFPELKNMMHSTAKCPFKVVVPGDFSNSHSF